MKRYLDQQKQPQELVATLPNQPLPFTLRTPKDAVTTSINGALYAVSGAPAGIISSPVDYVGINVYTPHYYVAASDDPHGFTVLPMPASFPHTSSPWHKIDPAALYWAPRHVAKLWNPRAIYITENGLSSSDQPAADGQVYDLDRIMLLRSYLAQLQRATAEGVPVQGYFLWSLLDNFEWSDGLERRYGLYRVDFETLQRTPKLSVSFYREVIARNAVA